MTVKVFISYKTVFLYFTSMHLSLLPLTSSLCITSNFDRSCASTSHFHLTSLHTPFLNIIPFSVISRLSRSSPFTSFQPSSTIDFSKSFCQILFFSICMVSSTTHLSNLYTYFHLQHFYPELNNILFASHTNGIILISCSIAFFGCSLPTRKMILAAHSCT